MTEIVFKLFFQSDLFWQIYLHNVLLKKLEYVLLKECSVRTPEASNAEIKATQKNTLKYIRTASKSSPQKDGGEKSQSKRERGRANEGK